MSNYLPEPAFEQLLAEAAELAGSLDRARDEVDVWHLITRFATRRLGARAALVLHRRGMAAGASAFTPAFGENGQASVARAFVSVAALSGMGLVSAPPPELPASAFDSLFAAIPAAATGGIGYAEIDTDFVLLLIYADGCPVLSRGHWFLLDAVRQEATLVLARLRHQPTLQPAEQHAPGRPPFTSRSRACRSDA
ncbi:MAG: hypothetical protein FIB01_14890 [Gemmatimonadetes bacterium]|nr:hypothetical protein [Gemmatimonadota bacterium]